MTTPAKSLPDLPLKRKRFCEEYLIDGNATQAAIRAGYSQDTAKSMGSRLLSFDSVQEHLAALEDGRANRVGITADEVLAELATLVRSNVTDYILTENGDLDLAPDVPESAWRAVSLIKRKTRIIPQKDGEPTREVEVEFRLWDKNAAIDKAMKHLGLTRDAPEARRRVMRFLFVDEGQTRGVEVIDGGE